MKIGKYIDVSRYKTHSTFIWNVLQTKVNSSDYQYIVNKHIQDALKFRLQDYFQEINPTTIGYDFTEYVWDDHK